MLTLKKYGTRHRTYVDLVLVRMRTWPADVQTRLEQILQGFSQRREKGPSPMDRQAAAQEFYTRQAWQASASSSAAAQPTHSFAAPQPARSFAAPQPARSSWEA